MGKLIHVLAVAVFVFSPLSALWGNGALPLFGLPLLAWMIYRTWMAENGEAWTNALSSAVWQHVAGRKALSEHSDA